MSRGTFTPGKREREAQKARKKADKEDRRRERRERGPQEIPVVSHQDAVGHMPSVEEAMRNLEARGTAPRAASDVPSRLFVGGLAYETTSATLRAAFEAYGPVVDAAVITDRFSGQSRGFGFVTMQSRKDAPKAVEALDGSSLDGRTIVVNVATERR